MVQRSFRGMLILPGVGRKVRKKDMSEETTSKEWMDQEEKGLYKWLLQCFYF